MGRIDEAVSEVLPLKFSTLWPLNIEQIIGFIPFSALWMYKVCTYLLLFYSN